MVFRFNSASNIAATRICCCFIFLIAICFTAFSQDGLRLELAKTIYGNITPKSIIYAGNGHFFAQNMMYSHKVTVYDRNYNLIKTIDDKVDLARLGHPEYSGIYRGAPVEAAFSDNGKYVWVTNYMITGEGFDNPGFDDCGTAGGFDSSFIYRINAKTFRIDAAVRVGSVPKYIAVTPDNKYVLVSNWCGGDLSVIDILALKEVKRIPIGLYPRGIAVDSKSQFAYVAIMGMDKIAKINLHDFSVKMMDGLGNNPRHLCITSDDKYLFASLNADHKVVKIDLVKQKVTASVNTGQAPRSVTLSADNQYLYVVNYRSGSLSVITTADMQEVQNVPTSEHPIGVAFDPETRDVWVACYSGSIQVFKQVPVREGLAKRPDTEISFQYHIIVGVFRDERNLHKLTSKCIRAGYKPYVVNPDGDIKKLSCAGFDDKVPALAELIKAKDIFGEGAWLLKQPMQTEISR